MLKCKGCGFSIGYGAKCNCPAVVLLKVEKANTFTNSADKCRANGWLVGTRLIGYEDGRPTTIEITAIGEESILAKCVGHAHSFRESNWTLQYRDWKPVTRDTHGDTTNG